MQFILIIRSSVSKRSRGFQYIIGSGLRFGRMYQVLLAAGDSEGAKALVSKIPKDDKDVQHIIEESQSAFSQAPNKKKPKKKMIVLSTK